MQNASSDPRGKFPASGFCARVWEYFSIRLKLPILFLVTLLVSTGYFTFYGYVQSRETLHTYADRQMLLATSLVEQVITPEYFDRAVSPTAVSRDEYEKNARELKTIAENIGLQYLYTIVKVDGRYYFTNSFIAPYFTEYDEDWTELHATSRDGIPRFVSGSDSYGKTRALIVRGTTPKGTHYCVGADISLPELRQLDKTMLRQAIGVGLVSFVFVGVFSFIISQLITRPLKKLSDYVLHIRRSGFATEDRINPGLLPHSDSAGDEIRLLAKSFDLMQSELIDFAARLQEAATTRERIESELRIAGGIQQNFLPKPLENADTFDVRGKMQPAKAAGGDLYDFFRLDENRLCFMIADVSGKGMPAAMFMATCLTLFRAAAKPTGGNDEKITEVMGWVDRRLAEHNERLMFVTALMGIFDAETGEIVLSNGGHNPPLLLRGDTCEYLELEGGTLLGIDFGKPYAPTRLTLRPGDALVLYTDGVTEAIAADDRFYGEQRLLDLLKDIGRPDSRAGDLVEAIFKDVADFSLGREQADDITVLVLKSGKTV
ncbi:MAG TPA: hypothetical protein DEB39_07785 [Planctomycetaceae bacterium]|nr:hypothetical protein [Planctomycetaceae bacterium]